MKNLSLSLLLLVGCFDTDRVPGGPPTGYETDVFSCEDGRDNDDDGLVDCQDPDCIARNFCGEIVPFAPPDGFENTFDTCTDRIDNDVDGQFDCGDRGCQAIRELCCVTEFSNAACSNGVDDDGNGFADCQDFSCRTNPFVTACQRELDCDDGFDNDGDRAEDCADSDCVLDPACGSFGGPENTEERCIDGIDNDGNSFTDCGDFGCCPREGPCITAVVEAFCDTGPTEPEDTTERCMDGIDNDGNGFSDCGEFGCCDRDGVCINAEVQEFCDSIPDEATLELCMNGIDDDGDGFTDCDDFSCQDVPGLGFACESDYASCIDKLDNEGDGFPDCSDFSCRDVVEEREFVRDDGSTVSFQASPCNEAVEFPQDFATVMEFQRAVQIAIERCTDGIDGDSDTLVDCDDWDCQWNPLLAPLANGDPAPGLCQGGVFDPGLDGGRWRAPAPGETPRLPDGVEPRSPVCR